MDAALAWAIAALVLVIAELLSGTFEQPFPTQCIVAALLGALGCYGVHVYRARSAATRMPPIDAGMPASFESWLDAGARLARVRYRGASWEARVEGSEALEPGATVFVLATDGNTLKVAKNRPA